MTAREVSRRIVQLGGVEVASKGSHRRYQAAGCSTIVAFHPGDIPIGTLRSIERQMETCFGVGWLRR
jgi:predicted RNA binding protein YcfA (HicA-like mRNA interferase family)